MRNSPEVLRTMETPGAIVILGGKMRQRFGQYCFPTIEAEGLTIDTVKAGGKAEAAAFTYELRPGPVFVTGGFERNDYGNFALDTSGKLISRAHKLADLLIKKYGVPEQDVTPVLTAGNTIGNAEGLDAYFSLFPSKTDTLRIISNDNHLPRSRVIFDDPNHFSGEFNKKFLSVEDILIRRDVFSTTQVEAFLASQEAQNDMENELQGIIAIEQGVYEPLSA